MKTEQEIIKENLRESEELFILYNKGKAREKNALYAMGLIIIGASLILALTVYFLDKNDKAIEEKYKIENKK